MRKLFLTLIFLSVIMTVSLLGGPPHWLQADEAGTAVDNLTSTVEDISKVDKRDMNSLLGAVGVSDKGFDMAKMLSYFIFGGIGFVAFVYGKKNSFFRPMLIGIVLNVYPYFISSTLWVYIMGIALTAALFIWRD